MVMYVVSLLSLSRASTLTSQPFQMKSYLLISHSFVALSINSIAGFQWIEAKFQIGPLLAEIEPFLYYGMYDAG